MLERDMEEIFGEDFSDHASSEMERLGKDFGNALQKYTMGQALTKKPGCRKPMFSGGPDTYTVAKVAATVVAAACGGGPIAAFAVQAAFTAVDVYDGTISLQQAAVQLAVSAASSYAGGVAGEAFGTAQMASSTAASVASQTVNMAASGITYNPDGGVGWSNSKFRQGVKSGVTNMAMNYALSANGYTGSQNGAWLKAGLSGFVNSGLQTDGGWTDWGFSASDWQDHLVAGAAAGAATHLSGRLAGREQPDANGNKTDWTGTYSMSDYTNKMLYNAVNAGIQTAWQMGYHGKSWEDSVAMTGLYSGMTYSISDMGGYLGNALYQKQYANEIQTRKEYEEQQRKAQEQARANGGLPADPLAGAEMGLSGIFESLWGGLKNLGNSLSNWVAGNGFQTDEEIEGKKIAVAAALAEFDRSRTADATKLVVGSFWGDTVQETEAKLQAMRDAGLDTTEAEAQIAKLREVDSSIKAQKAAIAAGSKADYEGMIAGLYDNTRLMDQMAANQRGGNRSIIGGIVGAVTGGNLYASGGGLADYLNEGNVYVPINEIGKTVEGGLTADDIAKNLLYYGGHLFSLGAIGDELSNNRGAFGQGLYNTIGAGIQNLQFDSAGVVFQNKYTLGQMAGSEGDFMGWAGGAFGGPAGENMGPVGMKIWQESGGLRNPGNYPMLMMGAGGVAGYVTYGIMNGNLQVPKLGGDAFSVEGRYQVLKEENTSEVKARMTSEKIDIDLDSTIILDEHKKPTTGSSVVVRKGIATESIGAGSFSIGASAGYYPQYNEFSAGYYGSVDYPLIKQVGIGFSAGYDSIGQYSLGGQMKYNGGGDSMEFSYTQSKTFQEQLNGRNRYNREGIFKLMFNYRLK